MTGVAADPALALATILVDPARRLAAAGCDREAALGVGVGAARFPAEDVLAVGVHEARIADADALGAGPAQIRLALGGVRAILSIRKRGVAGSDRAGLPRSVHAVIVVGAGDATRTVFAGKSDAQACEQYHGNESGSASAFASGDLGEGAVSCFFDNDEECAPCGQFQEGNGFCTNTCAPE